MTETVQNCNIDIIQQDKTKNPDLNLLNLHNSTAKPFNQNKNMAISNLSQFEGHTKNFIEKIHN